MNFQTINRQRKLILIAAVAGIISIFLPWFSAGAFGFSIHVNGFHGWGILAFLLFDAAVIISLTVYKHNHLVKACGLLQLSVVL